MLFRSAKGAQPGIRRHDDRPAHRPQRGALTTDTATLPADPSWGEEHSRTVTWHDALRSAQAGRVVFTCTPDESAYSPIGAVHGRPAAYTSVEIKVSYLRAAWDAVEANDRYTTLRAEHRTQHG